MADLILFHPYDGVPLEASEGHWGFDCLGGHDPLRYGPANDEHYLRYAVARLASFSNVWWSLANEWDLLDRTLTTCSALTLTLTLVLRTSGTC